MAAELRHGSIRYPSPLGDLYLNQSVDEITLMRLIDGMRDCGLEPSHVRSAQIGDTLVTFEFYDVDADGRIRLDSNGDPATRTIAAQR